MDRFADHGKSGQFAPKSVQPASVVEVPGPTIRTSEFANAALIARPLLSSPGDVQFDALCREFQELMASPEFLSKNPVPLNAGIGCYPNPGTTIIVPVDDAIDALELLFQHALLLPHRNSVFFDLSGMRPSADRVRSVRGFPRGPIDWLAAANQNLATNDPPPFNVILNTEHPDVLRFVQPAAAPCLKFRKHVLLNPEFMNSALRDEEWTFRNPGTRRPVRTLPTRAVLADFVQSSAAGNLNILVCPGTKTAAATVIDMVSFKENDKKSEKSAGTPD